MKKKKIIISAETASITIATNVIVKYDASLTYASRILVIAGKTTTRISSKLRGFLALFHILKIGAVDIIVGILNIKNKNGVFE